MITDDVALVEIEDYKRSISLISILKKTRVYEAFLLTGFVMISVPFFVQTTLWHCVAKISFLFLGTLFSFLSIYSMNSYFGYSGDRLNLRFRGNQFESPNVYLGFAFITTLVSLYFLTSINIALSILSLLNFLLWTIYSQPQGVKGRPVWGTVFHLVSQIIQFHMGVLTVSSISTKSLLLSLFFGLLFSSGHLIHELKDCVPDSLAGIKTSTVVYGPKVVFRFYRILLIGITLYWSTIYCFHQLSFRNFLLFFVAILVHLGLAFSWDSTQIQNRRLNENFQFLYRCNYLIAGLLFVFL